MNQVVQQDEPMTPAARQAALLQLSKVLLDEDRLKILGLLAQHPTSVESLNKQLVISKLQLHLAKLEEVGLVEKRTAAAGICYQLDSKQLLRLKKELFAREPEQVGQSAAEKDLAKFIKQERIVQLPIQPAKVRLVLEWLATKFQPGVTYPEKAVNELLQGHAIDHVTLRRLLIDHQLLVRQAGLYQRNEAYGAS